MNLKSLLRHRIIVAYVAVLILFGVAAVVLDWQQARKVMAEANWELVPIALLFVFISYGCLSYGFVVVNRSFGIKVGKRYLFDIGFVSSAMSHLVPAIGGYSVRFLLMQRRSVSKEDILATSLFLSYFNNLAMFSLLPIGLVGLAIHQQTHHGGLLGTGLAVGLITVLLCVATTLVFVRKLRLAVLKVLRRTVLFLIRRDIGSFLSDFDSTFTQGIAMMRRRPIMIVMFLLLIIGDWVATIVAFGFCFDALGGSIGTEVLITGFAIGIVAGVLSMIPGGIGIQEGSMAGIYALVGVPFEQAIMAAILFRVIYYFIPFIISLGFYPRLLRADSARL